MKRRAGAAVFFKAVVVTGCIAAAATLVGRARAAPDLQSEDLVVKGADGEPAPGRMCVGWKTSDDGQSVTFELHAADNAESVRAMLAETFAEDHVTVEKTDDRLVKVSGMAAEKLLRRLADPLSALIGLALGTETGGAPGDSGAQGGGSLRATNPDAADVAAIATAGTTATAAPLPGHDADERAVVRIIAVKQSSFPNVEITMEVVQPPRRPTAGVELDAQSVVTAPVVFSVGDGPIDVSGNPDNQRNAVGFYLLRGDRVEVHVRVTPDGKSVIDWLQRKPRPAHKKSR